jgi:hypothetical protein
MTMKYLTYQPVAKRAIADIAADILRTWERPAIYALPYINAMRSLRTIDDAYFQDDARSIVLYFLSNAATWRGDDAKRIKAELRALL